MKRLLISIFLVTLSHTDQRNDFLKTGKDVSLRNYINGKLDKYSGKGNARDLDAAKSKALQVTGIKDGTFNFLDKQSSENEGEDLALKGVDPRRYNKDSDSSSESHSSSRELRDWKEEWKEMWLQKKLQFMNLTDPGGDRVNMIAARPWGVPCGDPGQHDMPWGSCVLQAECDAEYRIYRGDYFCGRTQFVCCSLALATYDTYHGFDVSLQDTSMDTDSAEARNKKRNKSYERRKKRKGRRNRKRRRRLRRDRKRKIKKTIERIVREVKRILNKASRNGSRIRKKKTNTMKKFIRYLKKQYRMDRQAVMDIHEHQLWAVDNELLQKLLEIKDLNRDFMTNATFRNVILNRLMNAKAARMLSETYPELSPFIKDATRQGKELPRAPDPESSPERRSGFARRSGRVSRFPGRRKYLDYDVEYGLLYT